MPWLPLGFAAAAGAARPAEPAGAVVAAAADSAAADAHRLSADAAAVRHQAEGGDAAAHAVVAHAAAPDACDAGDPRRRRSAVESRRSRPRQPKSPLALLIDDGFPAAGTWDARMRTADDLISRAETDGRGVALIPLSETEPRHLASRRRARRACGSSSSSRSPTRSSAPTCCRRSSRFFGATAGRRNGLALRRRRPRRRLANSSRRSAARRNAHDHRDRRRPRAGAGARRRREHRRRADRQGAALRQGRARNPASCAGSTSRACRSAKRPSPSAPTTPRPKPSSTLPVEIRNDIARLEIGAERSAGAVQLLDKRWRRRTVGVVTGATADTAQPLLASTYYLTRALNPFADVRLAERGSPAQAVNQFIDQRLPMMILADVGNVAEARERLDQVDRGRRRAGALRRPAARRRRRRPRAGASCAAAAARSAAR